MAERGDDVDVRQTIEKQKKMLKNGGQISGKKKIKNYRNDFFFFMVFNSRFLYLVVTRRLLLIRDSTMAASTYVNREISYFLSSQNSLAIRRCGRNGIKTEDKKKSIKLKQTKTEGDNYCMIYLYRKQRQHRPLIRLIPLWL
jgi:hypothetical protein